MFNEERDYNKFRWEDLGDIKEGRPHLGLEVPVLAYRLLQYTFRDVMITELGVDKTNDIIIKAGNLAGRQLAKGIGTILSYGKDVVVLIRNDLSLIIVRGMISEIRWSIKYTCVVP